MESDKFEKVFEDFLECREYDDAHAALFTLARTSFKAGWQAAGGEPPQPQTKIRIFPNNPDNEPSK